VNIRNRVKSLRIVPANELRPNPKNWRTHPKAQADALRGVLAEVGMADACLARELPDGSLMLIDGHLRAETAANAKVPVLILDVNEAEADKILATLDPLAAMADSDAAKLDELLRTVDTGSEALQQMLAATAEQAGLYESIGSEAEEHEADTQESDSPYTDKVAVPPYEVTGPKPTVSAMYDEAKCRKLLADVDESNLPEAEKNFLRAAAYRHVVFNFQEIANYYAHSEADIQQLMEDSALVIVDFDKAIQNGWTRLGQAIAEVALESSR
jgi:ParB-like chromosome segregation protein Spo0J